MNSNYGCYMMNGIVVYKMDFRFKIIFIIIYIVLIFVVKDFVIFGIIFLLLWILYLIEIKSFIVFLRLWIMLLFIGFFFFWVNIYIMG